MGTTCIDKELRFRLLSEVDLSTETLDAKDNKAMLSKSWGKMISNLECFLQLLGKCEGRLKAGSHAGSQGFFLLCLGSLAGCALLQSWCETRKRKNRNCAAGQRTARQVRADRMSPRKRWNWCVTCCNGTIWTYFLLHMECEPKWQVHSKEADRNSRCLLSLGKQKVLQDR